MWLPAQGRLEPPAARGGREGPPQSLGVGGGVTLHLDFGFLAPELGEHKPLAVGPLCVVTCDGHHRTLIQRLDGALCPATTSEPLSRQMEAQGPRATVQRPGAREETAQELGRHERSRGTCPWGTGLGLNGPRHRVLRLPGYNWHCL